MITEDPQLVRLWVAMGLPIEYRHPTSLGRHTQWFSLDIQRSENITKLIHDWTKPTPTQYRLKEPT